MSVEFPAYVLAGGSSARFGSDKALLEIDGEVQLLRLMRQLDQLATDDAAARQEPRPPVARGPDCARVVANRADRYQALGITCLVDTLSDSGPMAGLASALQHRAENYGAGWLLLVNCDQVIWQAEWLAQLRQQTPTHSIVCFADDGRPQPVPGLYHSRLLPTALKQLAEKDLSLKNLLRQVPSATIATSVNPRRWSFNTPEELQRILLRSEFR